MSNGGSCSHREQSFNLSFDLRGLVGNVIMFLTKIISLWNNSLMI